ncbi:MAG: hypothetical protein L6V93_17135 [Clostridiales bacterium]|nr:MAG: hypothetical protein L6V93_17135 [Clostridiales bacterium]
MQTNTFQITSPLSRRNFSDNISSFVYRANVQSLYFYDEKNSLYVTLFNKKISRTMKNTRAFRTIFRHILKKQHADVGHKHC